MRKSTFIFVAAFFALASCNREQTPPNPNCAITQLVNNGIAVANISYDAEGRVSQVQYINAPELTYNITYAANQITTESAALSADYVKRVFTYDAAGNILRIKTYDGNPLPNEELVYTYSGGQIIADTLYESGSISHVADYTWQNGNIVKLVFDGTRIVNRGYDMAKTPLQGDIAWQFNYLENVGYYPATRNLLTSEYEEGSGTVTTGTANYTFDNTGKITGFTLGSFYNVTYTYQCN